MSQDYNLECDSVSDMEDAVCMGALLGLLKALGVKCIAGIEEYIHWNGSATVTVTIK
jgi:hypothetical protein